MNKTALTVLALILLFAQTNAQTSDATEKLRSDLNQVFTWSSDNPKYGSTDHYRANLSSNGYCTYETGSFSGIEIYIFNLNYVSGVRKIDDESIGITALMSDRYLGLYRKDLQRYFERPYREIEDGNWVWSIREIVIKLPHSSSIDDIADKLILLTKSYGGLASNTAEENRNRKNNFEKIKERFKPVSSNSQPLNVSAGQATLQAVNDGFQQYLQNNAQRQQSGETIMQIYNKFQQDLRYKTDAMAKINAQNNESSVFHNSNTSSGTSQIRHCDWCPTPEQCARVQIGISHNSNCKGTSKIFNLTNSKITVYLAVQYSDGHWQELIYPLDPYAASATAWYCDVPDNLISKYWVVHGDVAVGCPFPKE